MRLWSKIASWRQERAAKKRRETAAAALSAMPAEARDELQRHVAFLRAQGVSVRELAPGEDPGDAPQIGEKPL